MSEIIAPYPILETRIRSFYRLVNVHKMQLLTLNIIDD
jgi:hypothetical protein